MRLIDADALVENLKNNVAGKGELGIAVAEIFVNYINSAPTVDAVAKPEKAQD